MKRQDTTKFEYFSYSYKGIKRVAYCKEKDFIKSVVYEKINKEDFDRFYEYENRAMIILESKQRDKSKNPNTRPVLN